MSPKSSLSSTWSSLASKLRGSKASTTDEPGFPRIESKTEEDWNANIKAETEVARKRAKKTRAKTPLSPTPVLERRLVVFHKCPWFGYSGAGRTKRKKRIWYKRDGDAMSFSVVDLSDYTLKGQQECLTDTPELVTAVESWLTTKKNRKEGWQFKCTIADGEKSLSNRIPSRFGTFVVYVLIERVVSGQAGSGIAHDQELVKSDAVVGREVTATVTGVRPNVLEPVSAETAVDTDKAELENSKDKQVDQSPISHGWVEQLETK